MAACRENKSDLLAREVSGLPLYLRGVLVINSMYVPERLWCSDEVGTAGHDVAVSDVRSFRASFSNFSCAISSCDYFTEPSLLFRPIDICLHSVDLVPRNSNFLLRRCSRFLTLSQDRSCCLRHLPLSFLLLSSVIPALESRYNVFPRTHQIDECVFMLSIKYCRHFFQERLLLSALPQG